MQARTPAVPEERAHKLRGVTKGIRHVSLLATRAILAWDRHPDRASLVVAAILRERFEGLPLS